MVSTVREQIIGILKQHEAGVKTAEVCRGKGTISEIGRLGSTNKECPCMPGSTTTVIIETREISETTGSKSGFVVIFVPKSDGPPNRFRKDSKFYIRVSVEP
jgi:hypothetical protein